MSEQQNGYYVEFKRGWWKKKNGATSRQEKGPAIYHGSVTLAQAEWLEQIIAAFLDGKTVTIAGASPPEADQRDAARWRWLLSRNAMPSADGDYGTPSIAFHLPDEQQGQWIARGGEDLNLVVDAMRQSETLERK